MRTLHAEMLGLWFVLEMSCPKVPRVTAASCFTVSLGTSSFRLMLILRRGMRRVSEAEMLPDPPPPPPGHPPTLPPPTSPCDQSCLCRTIEPVLLRTLPLPLSVYSYCLAHSFFHTPDDSPCGSVRRPNIGHQALAKQSPKHCQAPKHAYRLGRTQLVWNSEAMPAPNHLFPCGSL